MKLQVIASITGDQVHDQDDVPTVVTANCRYWGAFPDSPVPNTRVWVMFNRDPVSGQEADEAAKELLRD